MSFARNDMRQALDKARAEGWTVERTTGDHVRLRHPNAEGSVITSLKTGDYRAIANFQANLRRALRDSRAATAERRAMSF